MKNRCEIRGDVTCIYLDRKNGTVLETMISTSDLVRVNDFPNKWCAAWSPRTRTFYVIGPYKGSTVKLHRWIMQSQDKLVIDHINHDTLDNTRKNLREVTLQQNGQNVRQQTRNKSGCRGVVWHKKQKKWNVRIIVDGKCICFGSFIDLDKAEQVAIEARRKHMPFSV